ELHGPRTLSVGPSRPARRSEPREGLRTRGADGGPRPALRVPATRSTEHVEVSGLPERAPRELRADDALPAAAALHDCGPHGLGWARAAPLPVRLTARGPEPLRRLLPDRPELQPRSAGDRVPGVRGRHLRPGHEDGRVATARASALRSQRGAAPQVRLRRRRLPARDGRPRARVTSLTPRV